jgi:type IV pilus assembly protein PilB
MQQDNYQIKENIKELHDITNTIELVDSLIFYAYMRKASDIHIDPVDNGVVIRFRVDGVLVYIDTVNIEIHQELIARIKIISSLRTDIHYVPQDGRFNFEKGACICDVRVSILPTHYGENAVLRILIPQDKMPSLIDLGFSEHDNKRIFESINKHQGMILVTGPTGSGKTSTLYTLIKHLAKDNVSIITLEDPIEYAMPKVRQINIREKHGVSFASGLRSIVRQDPDIIMVGEIRDKETAQIATNISLTGHLLLSTLHTNSAIGAIPRLMDMGVDQYLVANTLTLIIAQRLVRKSCEICKSYGCTMCNNTGYNGRTVVSETLTIDEEMRKYIMSRISLTDMYRYAKASGMITMYEDGMEKVEKNITTKAEILRVLHD